MHPSSSPTVVGPLRILVVDDENLIRWAVSETLTSAGHSVIEAADGATALRVMAETPAPFDVVVLDFRLPDSDDLSLAERICRHAPSTAIVMMTAYGTPQTAEHAKQLGVFAIIAKPFDMAVLEDVIAKAYQSKAH